MSLNQISKKKAFRRLNFQGNQSFIVLECMRGINASRYG